MSENDAPVESPAENASEGATAEEPVETPLETSAESASETGGDSAPTTEDSGDSADTWNGELETIQSSDWFEKLPGDVQGLITSGLENKYKNWQRGYNDKFQSVADKKKALEEREQSLKDSEKRVQRWLYGEEDPISSLQEQIEGLKGEKEKIEADLRTEMEKALEELREGGKVDLNKVSSERDAALEKLAAIEQKTRAVEEAQLDQEVEELDSWLQEAAPDLYKDYGENKELTKARDDAFLAFCKISMMGVDKEMALQMLRVQHPVIKAPGEAEEKEAAQPEEVPASVDLMNMGTGGRAEAMGKGDTRSFDDIMDSLRRAAQRHI